MPYAKNMEPTPDMEKGVALHLRICCLAERLGSVSEKLFCVHYMVVACAVIYFYFLL